MALVPTPNPHIGLPFDKEQDRYGSGFLRVYLLKHFPYLCREFLLSSSLTSSTNPTA